jgi:hypothetical protein
MAARDRDEREVADRARARVGPAVGEVREVDVDGSLTIYRRDIDQVLVLNRTASDVWRLSDGTLDEAEVVDRLAQVYGLDPEDIVDDVRATIARFVREGFIALTLP